MRTMTSLDAQNHFGKLIDTLQREPEMITRRGSPLYHFLHPLTQDMALPFHANGSGIMDIFSFTNQLQGIGHSKLAPKVLDLL